jgi:hypothetical protein
VLPDFFQVQREGIRKQHQDQAERGEHPQQRRLDTDIEQRQRARTKDRPEREKYRDLWQAGPLHRSGQQRGDDNDSAAQGEGRKKQFGRDGFHEPFPS